MFRICIRNSKKQWNMWNNMFLMLTLYRCDYIVVIIYSFHSGFLFWSKKSMFGDGFLIKGAVIFYQFRQNIWFDWIDRWSKANCGRSFGILVNGSDLPTDPPWSSYRKFCCQILMFSIFSKKTAMVGSDESRKSSAVRICGWWLSHWWKIQTPTHLPMAKAETKFSQITIWL